MSANSSDDVEQLSRSDFQHLPLDVLARRTGLQPPRDPTPEEEAAFREKAWNSYATDVENRDEWGTATQTTELPQGEEPEL